MKTQNIVLIVSSLIIGGLAVALFAKLYPCEPPAKYVMDLKGAEIADGNVDKFKEALKAKAVFTHHFSISHPGGPNQAPELENTHVGKFCLPSGASAPHVTQRAGVTSLKDLQDLESYLTP